jgi:hypothetical protein
MLTFTEILHLLIMSTPKAPPNTPQHPMQQGNAPQSVNGTVEHCGQAEMTPSSDNVVTKVTTLLDNYIADASKEDKRNWTSHANNTGEH